MNFVKFLSGLRIILPLLRIHKYHSIKVLGKTVIEVKFIKSQIQPLYQGFEKVYLKFCLSTLDLHNNSI